MPAQNLHWTHTNIETYMVAEQQGACDAHYIPVHMHIACTGHTEPRAKPPLVPSSNRLEAMRGAASLCQ